MASAKCDIAGEALNMTVLGLNSGTSMVGLLT